MPWNYRTYGTIDDPIHKSDLVKIVGDYGCLRSFRYDKDNVADGKRRDSEFEVNGKMAAGTAVHECIARALSNRKVLPKLLGREGPWAVSVEQCRRIYNDELDRAVAGREVKWYDDDAEAIAALRAEMLAGVLNDMRKHVRSVRLIEAGFIVKIGGYWCSGHTDLIYEPQSHPGELALGDWKTGAQRPHPIELDHSWESGIYSAAMRDGLWISREHVELEMGTPDKYMREREALEAELIRVAKLYQHGEIESHVHQLGAFPADIRYVHLGDYPPYKKAGRKEVNRPEELAFYRMDEPGSRKFTAGEQRGPAWYQVRRTEQDMPRLESLLRNIVGTVRMGRFFESVGEKCSRCAHKQVCLNSGYDVRGEEQQRLERALKIVGDADDGLGSVA